MEEVVVGEVSSVDLEGLGQRRVAGHGWTEEQMRVRVAFTSKEKELLPAGYLIPAPRDGCKDALRLHGLQIERLTESAEVLVSAFTPAEVRRARREFQGHHEVGLRGKWGEPERRKLPAGTWYVTARQPLGRVAAQLLEPLSEDSLSTWNVFEAQTRATGDQGPGAYPVLRLVGDLEGPLVSVPGILPR